MRGFCRIGEPAGRKRLVLCPGEQLGEDDVSGSGVRCQETQVQQCVDVGS